MSKYQLTKEQEAAANTFGKSIAVSAAAGSGKTSVLTERIIEQICNHNGDVSRILAVTFTKAAAAEMATRVTNALSQKLAENPDDAHIARQALLVSSAKICTVDKFCLGLVKENIQALGLESDIAPGDDARMDGLMSSVMNALIEDYFENRVEGDDKIDSFGEFADIFGSLKNTDKLCGNLIKIYTGLSTKALFLDALDPVADAYSVGENYEFFHTYLGGELFRFTSEMFRYYEKVFQDAVGFLDANEVAKSESTQEKYRERYETVYRFCKEICDTLASGADYKTVSVKILAFSKDTNSVKSMLKDSQWEFFKKSYTEFTDEFKVTKDSTGIMYRYYGYNPDEVRNASAKTREMILKLKTVLTAFDKRFTQEKDRNHVISFSDMEHMALKLLWNKQEDRPTDLARSLRDSFDEIYIDEYQDTNELQNKIFTLISRDNNTFIVGDVKQSIYQFRGAVPAIFNEILQRRTDYFEQPANTQTKIFLSKNFRSTNEILDFCNSVFDVLMNVGKNDYGVNERLYPGTDNPGKKTEIRIFEKDGKKDPEAEYIAKRISCLVHEGYQFSDIAVLVRNMKQAEGIVAEMEKRKIPCATTEGESFLDSPEIMLVISLLNAINNPASDVYLAATLQSPLYGFSLDELIEIRKKGSGTLYEALVSYARETGNEKCSRFLNDLHFFGEAAKNSSCDQLIRQLYSKLGLLSVLGRKIENDDYDASKAKQNLMKLYEISRSYSGKTYRSLFDFVSYLQDVLDGGKELKAEKGKGTKNLVTVSTIHKSKGLEYPVVFLSRTDSPYGHPDRDEMSSNLSALAVKLMKSNGLGKVKTLQYTLSFLPADREKIEEELRILYVALTRPKCLSVITGTASQSKPFDVSGKGLSHYRKKYLSPYSLYRMKSYLEMISTAIAGNDNFVLAGDCEDMPVPEESKKKETVQYHPDTEKLVGERLDFRYKDLYDIPVPAKISVSKLDHDLEDEDEEAADMTEEKSCNISYIPEFLRDQGERDSASAGTAMHHFMEFFDFRRCEENGVEKEIGCLVRDQFLSPAEAKMLEVRKLKDMMKSDFADLLRTGYGLIREQRFVVGLPVREAFESAEIVAGSDSDKVLVQGVIDCLIRGKDGRYILIDYKTDHFPKGKSREDIRRELTERHAAQLRYYKMAVEKTMGFVSHVYIYSFALNEMVEI